MSVNASADKYAALVKKLRDPDSIGRAMPLEEAALAIEELSARNAAARTSDPVFFEHAMTLRNRYNSDELTGPQFLVELEKLHLRCAASASESPIPGVEALVKDWELHDRPIDSRWAALAIRSALAAMLR